MREKLKLSHCSHSFSARTSRPSMKIISRRDVAASSASEVTNFGKCWCNTSGGPNRFVHTDTCHAKQKTLVSLNLWLGQDDRTRKLMLTSGGLKSGFLSSRTSTMRPFDNALCMRTVATNHVLWHYEVSPSLVAARSEFVRDVRVACASATSRGWPRSRTAHI